MKSKEKSMNATCLYTHEVGGSVKFAGAKKKLANSKEINTLVTSDVAKDSYMNNKSKVKAMDNFNSKNDSENFNVEKLDIRADSKSEKEHVNKG